MVDTMDIYTHTSGTVRVVAPLIASSIVWVWTSRCSNCLSNWSISWVIYSVIECAQLIFASSIYYYNYCVGMYLLKVHGFQSWIHSLHYSSHGLGYLWQQEKLIISYTHNTHDIMIESETKNYVHGNVYRKWDEIKIFKYCGTYIHITCICTHIILRDVTCFMVIAVCTLAATASILELILM